MRIIREGRLIRVFSKNWGEFAYASFGLSGLQCEIEFPSDWHERRAAWVRLGFGFTKLAFSFPWKWVVEDHYQCSGPTYGFLFFNDGLHLHWGKCTGKRSDPMAVIGMPWRWIHRRHEVLSSPETWPYKYKLRSGDVQERQATIQMESRLWTRWWFPWRRFEKSINVTFNDEVGERSGSWKGGCIGCSYVMRGDETPFETLMRMERDRKF